jgi:hypothetical protein
MCISVYRFSSLPWRLSGTVLSGTATAAEVDVLTAHGVTFTANAG